jgi:hypothetical protein
VPRPREPYPSGPEHFAARLGEGCLKPIDTAEISINRVGKDTTRSAACARRHGPPEQGVVHMSPRVVVNSRSRCGRHLAQVKQEPNRAASMQCRNIRERCVQVSDVTRVVFVVVQLHRAGIDVRLECRIVVWQRW